MQEERGQKRKRERFEGHGFHKIEMRGEGKRVEGEKGCHFTVFLQLSKYVQTGSPPRDT